MNFLKLITIFFLLIISDINAQQTNTPLKESNTTKETSKSWVNAMVGVSFPVGFFSNYSIAGRSGKVENGMCYKVDYAHMFQKNAAFIFTVSGGNNKYDVSDYWNGHPPIINESVQSNVNGTWSHEGVLAGFLLKLPHFTSHAFFKMQCGYYIATSPSVSTVLSHGDGTTETLVQESSTSGAFAYSIGLGGDIPLGNKLAILLNADMLSFQPSFDNVRASDNYVDPNNASNNRSQNTIRSFYQRVDMYSLCIGLQYRIK